MDADRSDRKLLQITLTRDQYEILRKEAYKLDMTINKTIVLKALEAVRMKK